MSQNEHNDALDKLMADVRVAAESLDLPVADSVWGLMRLFEREFLEYPVGFRITTKAEKELNVRYQTLDPGDPYGPAVERGFLTVQNHPVYHVIPELQKMRPNAGYFVDLGVTHGLEKNWGYFMPPFTIDEVATMGFMPPAISKHIDLLKHYELEWICAIGVDYVSHTTNIYFPEDTFPNTPEIARQTIIDMGYDAPPNDENEFNSKAFVLYLTFSWDSEHIERASYAQKGPVANLPAHWPILLHKFAEEAPLLSEERVATFNTCYGYNMHPYYKLEMDYRASISEAVDPLLKAAVQVARTAKAEQCK